MSTPAPVQPLVLILMGVAGSGKTTIARHLAQETGAHFLEGDDFHPAANLAKMRQGQPLTDADRAPWLRALRQEIDRALRAGQPLILTCSALKQVYRDQLQQADPRIQFIHLTLPRAILAERLVQRTGHFLPASLLDSQLATLEPPAHALVLINNRAPAAIVATIKEWLAAR